MKGRSLIILAFTVLILFASQFYAVFQNELIYLETNQKFITNVRGQSLDLVGISAKRSSLGLVESMRLMALKAKIYQNAYNYGEYSEIATQMVYRQYDELLKLRPSWPYYWLGKLNIASAEGLIRYSDLEKVITMGGYESSLYASIANIVFNNWQNFDTKELDVLMTYLLRSLPDRFFGVFEYAKSSKRVYEICDFAYEKTGQIPRSCQYSYWQSLQK
ncbi:MAG: hypothetical protein L3J52_06005 [Proteobacteria bacterium]|nr:hypothetical protein [Pseudomonadota bacterium]